MIISYWTLVLLTWGITELIKDELVKNRKAMPWVALVVALAVSLVYVWWHGGQDFLPAVVRGLTGGLIATGMYKLVKDYYRAMRRA